MSSLRKLNLYPFADISPTLEKFDKQGVPLFKVGKNYFYNPVRVCLYALHNYNLWRYTGFEGYLRKFKIQVNWLEENGEYDRGLLKWFYKFDWPSYNLKAPWYSGMAQGLAASTLLRAYQIWNDEKYLRIAGEAVKTMITPIEQGGTLSTDKYGVFIEEVITHPPSHILNGNIFGILGLYEYNLITGEYGSILNDLVKTLTKTLDEYDLGYWSAYCLYYRRPAPLHYHYLHIRQLTFMYQLFNEPIFIRKAIKWSLDSNRISTLSRLVFKRTLRAFKVALRKI